MRRSKEIEAIAKQIAEKTLQMALKPGFPARVLSSWSKPQARAGAVFGRNYPAKEGEGSLLKKQAKSLGLC